MTTATIHIVTKTGDATEQRVTFFRQYDRPLPCWLRMEDQFKHVGKSAIIQAVAGDRTFDYTPGRWLDFQDWWYNAL